MAALYAEIERLRVAVVDSERESGELLGGEEEAARADVRAAATRLLLDAAKDRYIAAAERHRLAQCPTHGEAIYVACPDCQIIIQRLMPTRAA